MDEPARVRLRVLGAALLIAATAACQASSPAPSPSAPSESAAPSVQTACSGSHSNAPGTYDVSAEETLTIPATITLAQPGWTGCGLLTKEYGPPAGLGLIAFWHVENVYTDPCHWQGALLDPPVG